MYRDFSPSSESHTEEHTGADAGADAAAVLDTHHYTDAYNTDTETRQHLHNYHWNNKYAILHQSFVLFLLFNIIYNYILCITTSNKQHSKYEQVVRELAHVTNFQYPEKEEDIDFWRDEYRRIVLEKSRRIRLGERVVQGLGGVGVGVGQHQQHQQHNNNNNNNNNNNMKGRYELESESDHTFQPQQQQQPLQPQPLQRRKINTNLENTTTTATATTTTIPANNTRTWMILGPNDWGFCDKSYLPKPPRSHYDYVTKSLVLNMDHYCPWMFNVGKSCSSRSICTDCIYLVLKLKTLLYFLI